MQILLHSLRYVSMGRMQGAAEGMAKEFANINDCCTHY